MEQDIEFIKKVANITVKKYCRKYNVDYSNLIKGNIKNKDIIQNLNYLKINNIPIPRHNAPNRYHPKNEHSNTKISHL